MIDERDRRDDLVASLSQMVERLSTLLEITRLLAAEIEPEALLQLIVSKTTQVLGAERSTVYLIDDARRELWSKVAERAEIAEIRLSIDGPGLAAYAARTGETVNIPDAYKDSRFNPEVDRRTGWCTRNMLVMPMRDRKSKIVGVFQVMNRKGGAFSGDDEELLASLAASAAIAVENAQVYAAQKRSYDRLRKDYEALRIEIDEAKKARQVAAITDTDYFRSLQAKVERLRNERRER